MDRATRSNAPIAVVFVLVGTVLLSPLMLVMAINGLLLGILLLPVLPLLASGWLAAESLGRAVPGGVVVPEVRRAIPAVSGREPPPVMPEPTAPLIAVTAAKAALAPVRIRVATARGVCPMGYRFEAGTEYVFRNGETSPAFCPVARRALTPLVTQVRRGEIPATLKPFCKTSVHEIVFEFAAGALAAREVRAALP